MTRQTFIQRNSRKAIIAMLKPLNKQFYDENGQPCSVETYVDQLLSTPLADVLAYQKEIDAKKKAEKEEKDNAKQD